MSLTMIQSPHYLPSLASLAYIILTVFTQSHESCWNCALPLLYKVHFLIGMGQKQADVLEGNRLLLKNY